MKNRMFGGIGDDRRQRSNQVSNAIEGSPMTRVERAQELERMIHSPEGRDEINRIWMAMRERRNLTEPQPGMLYSKMVSEFLDDEFPQGQPLSQW